MSTHVYADLKRKKGPRLALTFDTDMELDAFFASASPHREVGRNCRCCD